MAANPQNLEAQTTARIKLKKSQATAGGIEESGTASSCLFSKRGGKKLQREGKKNKTSMEIPYTELAGRQRGIERGPNPSLPSSSLVGKLKEVQFSN